MSQDLSNRIGVVTGASSGIGEAIVRTLGAQGARVVVNARRKERLGRICAEINEGAEDSRAIPHAGDASDRRTVEGMLNRALDHFGREADLVVVNAGRGLNGSVLTSDPGEWEEMIRTNLMGAARLMRAAAKRMLNDLGNAAWQERPRDIVVIGSVVGRHVSPFSSMYGSTKFAVNSLAEALRREVSPKGIRVTLIEPGFVKSEFQGVAGYDPAWFEGVVEKIGPVLEPADVARSVSFITSQPAHVHVSDVLVRPTRQEYP
jgi:NADP-dependent 3-hydroxy acid dehydrogenase YdfG